MSEDEEMCLICIIFLLPLTLDLSPYLYKCNYQSFPFIPLLAVSTKATCDDTTYEQHLRTQTRGFIKQLVKYEQFQQKIVPFVNDRYLVIS